jgi:hypothetical protein
VHRDAPDVVVEQLAFPGVQAGPDLQAVLGQLGPDGIGRADGSGRAVKGGQEPIPGRLDLATTKSRQIRRTAWWCSSRTRCQRRSPSSAATLVESTMSVNSTVARIRSGSATGSAPVRNSWVSSITVSWSPKNGKWSWPGSSTNLALGSRWAMYRLACTSASRSPVRCSTSTGTWTDPSSPRMSTRAERLDPVVEFDWTRRGVGIHPPPVLNRGIGRFAWCGGSQQVSSTPKGNVAFTFVTDGIASALEQARAAAGARNIAIGGGPSTAQGFVEAGVLDEIQIHLIPVLLGEGIRLFGQAAERLDLAPTRVIEAPDATHLRYRVLR